MMHEAILEAKNLSYGTPQGRPLATGLNFRLSNGGLLLVTGQNGSGKSTLLRLILKKLSPLQGELGCSIPLSKVAFVPQLQNTSFHLPLTLLDVLRISSSMEVRLEQILKIGLLDAPHLGLAWNTASGGERKRTLLTRTLLQGPELLLLDEPMNHLDYASQERVKHALSAFLADHKNKTRGIVLVSHSELLDSEIQSAKVSRLKIGEQELESRGRPHA